MHATIDGRFTVSIDEDKTIPVATPAEFVTEQNVESVLLESMVERLDASCVEALCGVKHVYGNDDQRFQRAGTDPRTVVTTAGEHEFSLHYIEDTAAGPTNPATPGLSKTYSTSTGKTATNRILPQRAAISLPRSAIVMLLTMVTAFSRRSRRRVRSIAASKNDSKLTKFLPEGVAQMDADAVIADGRKGFSQTTTARTTLSRLRTA